MKIETYLYNCLFKFSICVNYNNIRYDITCNNHNRKYTPT